MHPSGDRSIDKRFAFCLFARGVDLNGKDALNRAALLEDGRGIGKVALDDGNIWLGR